MLYTNTCMLFCCCIEIQKNYLAVCKMPCAMPGRNIPTKYNRSDQRDSVIMIFFVHYGSFTFYLIFQGFIISFVFASLSNVLWSQCVVNFKVKMWWFVSYTVASGVIINISLNSITRKFCMTIMRHRRSRTASTVRTANEYFSLQH